MLLASVSYTHLDLDGNGELTSRDAYLFMSQFKAGAFGVAPKQITSKTRNNVKTLAWNPNDGQLYAVTFSSLRHSAHAYFYSMNPETGAETMHKDFRTEVTALIIPQKATGGSWSSPTDQISGVQISAQSMTLLKGSRKTLSATVQPWTATDLSLIHI